MSYRVSFCGVFPSLLPSANDRHTYTRNFATREEAAACFRDEPSAYQLDRWESETDGWVMLQTRDRPRAARVYSVRR